ncbi:MAG: DUF1573 domain-containing protein, partial [Lentisphaerae bacterium]|nr:DUF1573 domain-containing protein [Lentisphaerota bacterium]
MPFQSPTLSPTRRGSLLPAAIPILILAAVLITMPAAQAKSLKLSHDFGSVWRGTVQRESVRVTAPADQTVTIRKTRTSCGCLRIAQCPASIPAGTSADIVLALDTNTLEGKVSFTAYIETDVAKMRLIKVKTLANVTSLLRVTPPAIDFGTN